MDEVELYKGVRRSYRVRDGRIYAHCPKCGRLSVYSRAQGGSDGAGMIFTCWRCPVEFTDQGETLNTRVFIPTGRFASRRGA